MRTIYGSYVYSDVTRKKKNRWTHKIMECFAFLIFFWGGGRVDRFWVCFNAKSMVSDWKETSSFGWGIWGGLQRFKGPRHGNDGESKSISSMSSPDDHEAFVSPGVMPESTTTGVIYPRNGANTSHRPISRVHYSYWLPLYLKVKTKKPSSPSIFDRAQNFW